MLHKKEEEDAAAPPRRSTSGRDSRPLLPAVAPPRDCPDVPPAPNSSCRSRCCSISSSSSPGICSSFSSMLLRGAAGGGSATYSSTYCKVAAFIIYRSSGGTAGHSPGRLLGRHNQPSSRSDAWDDKACLSFAGWGAQQSIPGHTVPNKGCWGTLKWARMQSALPDASLMASSTLQSY